VSLDALVKLGGSLLETDLRPLLDVLAQHAKTKRLGVVPGGGPFADAVRTAVHRHPASEDAAHWMAILAMDQHAHLLASLHASVTLCAGTDAVLAATRDGRLAILAPYAGLREADPLPHDWNVTSDSLSAWLAGVLGARQLVLLKALDAPEEMTALEASEAGLVDGYFPEALAKDSECWVLNGRFPARVDDFLSERETPRTRLVRG
jgi:aspartokinase-like uncharacterized kinase